VGRVTKNPADFSAVAEKLLDLQENICYIFVKIQSKRKATRRFGGIAKSFRVLGCGRAQ
jgi:hypothetical protein